jgi:hypothetical protein
MLVQDLPDFRLKNEVRKFIYKLEKHASITGAEEKFQSFTRLEMAAY